MLVGLLDKRRFLEFIRYFIVFDRKKGKVAARNPQVFGVKSMIERIRQRSPTNEGDGRQGGVIWHTTGSGKSMAMVFLCKSLLLHPDLSQCRIIIVTDRVVLEKQLAKNFLIPELSAVPSPSKRANAQKPPPIATSSAASGEEQSVSFLSWRRNSIQPQAIRNVKIAVNIILFL